MALVWFRLSFGNASILVRCRGRFGMPGRTGRRTARAPTPTVRVSPSAGTTGPRIPESEGGLATPRSGGVPPAVRNRAWVVTSWNSSAELGGDWATTSKATKTAAGGLGVVIPAWW